MKITLNKSKIDMTKGPIMTNVLLFAIPIIIGNVLQYLYTTVDTLVIGRYCSQQALAAVGTSSQPVEVLLCIFMGLGSGITILISQQAGAGNNEKLKQISETAETIIFVCGIPTGIIGIFLSQYILKFMGVPDDTFALALTYTQIVFAGTLANIGYNINAGILRGLGDSMASLLFLVVSCISNIILDITLVAYFKLGVGGAALATCISMYIAWVVSIIYIRRRFSELSYSFLPKRCHKEQLTGIISIGLPIGLNNSLFSFGHMALQIMVNAQGSVFMAGNSVAGRITGLSNIAIAGLAQAATTFSGQNFGSKNYDRLYKGRIKIPFTSGIITIAFGLFFITIRMPILSLFSSDSMVLMYASRYVVVLLLSQWMYGVFSAISNIVNGTGKVKYTTIVNLLMLWAIRVPSAYLIYKYYDGTWIMLCYPISFAFGMICMIGYYIFSKSWNDIMKLRNFEKCGE